LKIRQKANGRRDKNFHSFVVRYHNGVCLENKAEGRRAEGRKIFILSL
jgi:hypothetical protein